MADGANGALELLTGAIDALTYGYRLAYEELTSGNDPASGFSVGVATWLGGSFLTMVGLVVITIVWGIVLETLRSAARRLLVLATRGSDLRMTQVLVAQYVRLESAGGFWPTFRAPALLDVLGGRDGLRDTADALIGRRPGSRIASLVLCAPLVLRGAAVFVRQLFTTGAGLFSLAATWWVVGRPGMDAMATLALGAQPAGGWDHLGTESVAALGLVVAALTFLLSRLRSARAIGHQEWRRNEADLVCGDLADCEVEIAKALRPANLVAVQTRWALSLWEARRWLNDDLTHREDELRAALKLPRNQWRHSTRAARLGRESAPAKQAAQAREAVESLGDYVRQIPDRNELRLRRSAPRRIARLASRWQLRLAVDTSARYLQVPTTYDFQPEPVEWRVRSAALDEGLDVKTLPWQQTSTARREEIVETVVRQWRSEADQDYRDFEESVHELTLEGLVAIAELRAAKDAIYAYLHPGGPLSRLMERLREV